MILQKIKDVATKIRNYIIFKTIKYVILPALIGLIIISSISATFFQHIVAESNIPRLYVALIAFIALCCCFYRGNKKKENDDTVGSIMKSIAEATIYTTVFTVIIVIHSCRD